MAEYSKMALYKRKRDDVESKQRKTQTSFSTTIRDTKEIEDCSSRWGEAAIGSLCVSAQGLGDTESFLESCPPQESLPTHFRKQEKDF